MRCDDPGDRIYNKMVKQSLIETICGAGHVVLGYTPGHLSGCPVYKDPHDRCCSPLRSLSDFPAVEAAFRLGGATAARAMWKARDEW